MILRTTTLRTLASLPGRPLAFLLILGLTSASVYLAATPTWAAEKKSATDDEAATTDGEPEFIDEDGDGFEDIDEDKLREQEKPKKKKLTREQRAAKKAAAKKKKAHDRKVAGIAKRLGKKQKGYFVVALETKKYKSAGGSTAPVLTYKVLLEDSRTAAAEAILNHLLNIERQRPKKPGASKSRPPSGNFKFFGRFDDIVDAQERQEAADLQVQELARANNEKLRNRGRGPLRGNPL